MDDKITDSQTQLLMLLYDGNSYYLNMGTVNTYDDFYPLYQTGHVKPSMNNAVWTLTIKGFDFVKAVNHARKRHMSKNDESILFAFEQGIKYAKRSSQDKITKFDFLHQALAKFEPTAPPSDSCG